MSFEDSTDDMKDWELGEGSDDPADSDLDVGEADMADDPMPEIPEPECVDGAKRCLDSENAGLCREGIWSVQECGSTETCVLGQCEPRREIVCEPGVALCFDNTAVQTCRASGYGYVVKSCADGESCFDGRCAKGEPVGASCRRDEDCLTNACKCALGGDECGPTELGFCVVEGCEPGSCGRDSVCSTLGSDLEAPSSFCAAKCSDECPEGMACLDLPYVSELESSWGEACFFDTVLGIGATCTTDEACVGGWCDTQTFVEGYCTADCSESGQCPEGYSCVQQSAEQPFGCYLPCGDGAVTGTAPCPLEGTGDRFDVTCRILGTQDGAALRVCAGT